MGGKCLSYIHRMNNYYFMSTTMNKYWLAPNKQNIWGLKANQQKSNSLKPIPNKIQFLSEPFTPMPENLTQLHVRPLIGPKHSPSQGITE